MDKTPILRFDGEYSFLSNFFPCPVKMGSLTFQSSEAAFQAAKTLDVMTRKYFTSLSASESKKLGRKVELRSDWSNIKLEVMRLVVLRKFQGNPELKEKLLETGDRYLEEGNTWNDKFWGVCRGEGANHLGKILMDVRIELRQEEKPVHGSSFPQKAIVEYELGHTIIEEIVVFPKPMFDSTSLVNAVITATNELADRARFTNYRLTRVLDLR